MLSTNRGRMFGDKCDTTALLQATSRTLADGLALSDEHGVVLAVNVAYQELYGFAEHELVGRSFSIIFPAERRSAAKVAYSQVFDKGVPSVHLASIRRADGLHRLVHSRTTFVDRNGARVAMLSAIYDASAPLAARSSQRSAPAPLELNELSLLYEAHARSALGFAQALLGDLTQAEQLVEETLLAVWRAGLTGEHDICAARPLVLSVLRRAAGRPRLSSMLARRCLDGQALRKWTAGEVAPPGKSP